MTSVQPYAGPSRRLLPVPADTVARLAALDTAAEKILDATTPENTRAAFDQDWQHWVAFCEMEDVPPTSVSPGLLIAFATWLAHPGLERPAQAPATITRRLAGVLDGWRHRKVDVPHGVTSGARRVVRAYAKDLAQQGVLVGRGGAPALSIRDLRRISDALPDTLAGIRDRAVLTVGFSAAARRSEIAALDVADLTLHDNGMKVRIRDSKTGRRHPAVRMGTHNRTCPVRCWAEWLRVSGIGPGPAFRAVNRHGSLQAVQGRLTPATIGHIVARAGLLVGIKLTGHSLRAGLATEARRSGHDAKTIAKQGGWAPNSAVLYGYMQIVDEWADNATEGLGL